MRVRDLINELSEFDNDAEVLVEIVDGDDQQRTAELVEIFDAGFNEPVVTLRGGES